MAADDAGRSWRRGNGRALSSTAALVYALPLLLLVETVALPIGVIESNRPHEIAHVNDALRAITVALFVATSMLLLTRARLVNDRRTAAIGVAFLVMAVGYPLSWAVAPIHADTASEALEPLMRTVCFAIAIAVVYVASGRNRPAPRPWAIVVTSSAGIAASLVTLVAVHVVTQRPLDVSPGGYATLQMVLGAGWLLVAWRLFTLQRRSGEAPLMTVALPFALLGLADLVRIHALLNQPAWLITAGALRVTAGAAAVVAAAAILQRALAAEAARLSSIERALAVTERLLTDEEHAQSQQRHDARSVVSAIHLAWTTLEKYGGRLTEDTRERLRNESLRELDRLREVIDPHKPGTAGPVRLLDVLAPAVAAQRKAGRDVELDVEECVVSANAADLQEVLLTLIAATESPGNRGVRLSARADHERVELAVEASDVLVGRPRTADEHDSEGRAIGYQACQRLMRIMGGDISQDGHGGYVLTLPAAGLKQLVEHPLEVADNPDVQAVVASGGFERAPIGGRRVDNGDHTRRQAIRNSPVIDDGEVDDQGVGISVLADVNTASAEDPGECVRQQGRSGGDDSGEARSFGHEPIDAPGNGLSIRQKVELS